MKTYSLNAEIVAQIVDLVAEKLEIVTMGLEEREVLTEVVALSVALYFSKINPTDDSGLMQ